MMASFEKYNGYTNWETWAIAAYLSNDEGSYNQAIGILRRADTPDEGAEDLETAIRNSSIPDWELSGVDYSELDAVNWAEVADSLISED